MSTNAAIIADTHSERRHLALVVAASASGTVFEWYDFFVYGLLTTIMAKQFFAGVNESAGVIFALLTFAAGPLVRPLGGLVFGRIGDRLGRKYAFLFTMSIMGLATFAIGLLPSYASVGIASPALLITMRVLQGFALGGEYSGAAIFLAEHAPQKKRGLYTGWVQSAASLGLFLSLLVVLASRTAVGEGAFADWGWRIPYFASMILLAISMWIRLKLQESPSFQRLRASGAICKAPYSESFLVWRNLRVGIVALFAFLAAQGVIWYTYHFYTQIFLERFLHVDATIVNGILMLVVACSAPMYFFFAWISDYIGRKFLMALAIALSALLIFPLFHQLTEAANPALAAAQAASPVAVVADSNTCSLQFDPVGTVKFVSSCDIAKSALADLGVNYANQAAPAGAETVAEVRVGSTAVASVEGGGLTGPALAAEKAGFTARLKAALKAAGYPDKADPAKIDTPRVIGIFLIFMVLATMLYGPMAAALVELFPTRIRYTALSLPYNIGTGWFGGLLPAVAFAMVVGNGNIYYGLWYPVVVSAVSAVVALIFLPETHKRDIDAVT